MKAPAFQFYPADFMMGTAEMTAAEVGGYIRALCFQWVNGGLPNNRKKLKSMFAIDEDELDSILLKFKLDQSDDRLKNDRLELIRSDFKEYQEKQKINGKKGGNPNFKKGAANPYYKPKDNPTVIFQDNPTDNPKINPSPSPSFSPLPSNSISKKKKEKIAVAPLLVFETPFSENEAGNETDDLNANFQKNSTLGGAVTQDMSNEELNDLITQDVKVLKARMKETTDKQEKKLLVKEIIALEGKFLIMYPYNSDEFFFSWEKWILHKRKTRMYGTVTGQQEALMKLNNLAGGNEEKAIQLIDYAINKNWQDFYPMATNNSKNHNTNNVSEGTMEFMNQFDNCDELTKKRAEKLASQLNRINSI